MGINGGIVRSVFSRTRSFASSGTCHHHGNGRSNGGEKKRWSVVRLYLCGDEFNSVQGHEDSASVKSSAATGSHFHLVDGSVETEGMIKEEEKRNSASSLFLQEDAAIIIQTAFRKLMARRQNEEEAKMKDDDMQEKHPEMGSGSPGSYSVSTSIEVQTGNSVDVLSIAEETKINDDDDDNQEQYPEMRSETPGRYSVSTSIEVQIGNSVDVLSIAEEYSGDQCSKTQKKASRSQDFRSKEDWDDSTLSSNVLQMRIQNRLEATNRRERALAYAFSQQLRICPRKKQAQSECMQQPSTSWHWLERWMATRAPEFSFESHSATQFEQPPNNNSHGDDALGKTKSFDLAVEEKESCGSNEVPVPAESLTTDEGFKHGSFTATRKRTKPLRSISRRKTVPSYQCPPKEQKTVKKSYTSLEHDKEQKLKRSNSNRETKCKDDSASYNYGNMHFLVN